jgi:NhaP-type Na+/H+ or K+/H+ antiporter
MSTRGEISNPLEVIGPLILVFLLVETSIPLGEPRLYFGSLFSGAGVGIVLAVISIALIKKVSSKYESWIFLGQVYLAYWIAFALKTSPIAAVLISVIVFVEFHHTQLGGNKATITPAQLDNRLPFFILLILFIFTAWQTHHPVSLIQWFEVFLGLCIGLLVPWSAYRGISIRAAESNWRSALKLGIFLIWHIALMAAGQNLTGVDLAALGKRRFYLYYLQYYSQLCEI